MKYSLVVKATQDKSFLTIVQKHKYSHRNRNYDESLKQSYLMKLESERKQKKKIKASILILLSERFRKKETSVDKSDDLFPK